MAYIPIKGDVVSLFFDSTSGSEQRGWRPALVISNDLFNERTGISIVCPITRSDRGYPFHVSLDQVDGIEGLVMVDQIRSVDFKARRARRVAVVPRSLIDEVLAILDACLYP
ncbi:MAG TPA: type II toxin-antitoxin system PemK/MazF family toxin [Rhodothermales bacterium]|nr:type II toxin-antitoxin system PemK/MazF family toxin [Rhodothermales bacterium]